MESPLFEPFPNKTLAELRASLRPSKNVHNRQLCDYVKSLKMFDSEDVFSLTLNLLHEKGPSIVGAEIAKRGMTPFGLWIQLQNGDRHNLFSSESLQDLDAQFKNRGGPWRTNFLFEKGASLLFPLANRLGGETKAEAVTSDILGHTVKMPANLTPIHIHGLLYEKNPLSVEMEKNDSGVQLRGIFENVFDHFWTGRIQVKVMYKLEASGFSTWLQAENKGESAVPVGAGSHPYFHLPSKNWAKTRILIPSDHVLELKTDGSKLPTGRIVTKKEECRLGSEEVDQMWVDLREDKVELVDFEEKIKVSIQGLSKNIRGVQIYSPKDSHFVAIELVTHLPDPRESVWGHQPTGLKLLEPGETFSYGYKIKLEAI